MQALTEEVKYLGHIVSPIKVAINPEKVAAIVNWPVPKKVKELQTFLGTTGYYQQYLKDVATEATPRTNSQQRAPVGNGMRMLKRLL